MAETTVPRLVIGGAASGVGKTTVTVALAQALRARGLKVAAFKCGPDYLDPTCHARATGRVCHNLDGWMMGRDAVLRTFGRATRGADLALIEGVMGLFDGAAPTSDEGSTAEIARWLDAPVVAVLDASGLARTLAALGHGLATFDPRVRVAGLFANRVGSRGHLDLLKQAAPTVIGGLPARPALGFPERHLGLLTENISPEQLAAWGALLAEWCDLDALLALAREAPPLPATVSDAEPSPHRCRIGLAHDGAFHFYYDDNLRRLEALGAELVPFSPISEGALPGEVDGLYLGGGYPEIHAEALSRNESMRRAIAAFAGPIYAECGGLMYLAQSIRTLDGREYPMVGLIPGVAAMSERLQAIGYVEVETTAPTLLGGTGLRFRGHQFRHSTLEAAPTEGLSYRVRRRHGGATHEEGYGRAHVLASYVHAHWASNPLAAEGFVESCARFRGSR